MAVIDKLLNALIEGEDEEACAAAVQILAAGEDLKPIIAKMTETMRDLGRQFEEMEIYLPELMIAANAMISAMEVFEPHLSRGGENSLKGTVVMGSAPGDMHEIGKNIVGTMLKADGFKVIDLGMNVSPAVFKENALTQNAQIIGISALMTTTMPGVKEVIAGLGDDRCRFKVMVGGAPTNPQWAKDIGADGWSENAAEAVLLANRLIDLN